MKRIILVLSVILAGQGLFAQFSKASLQASGLTCALCTKAINKSLEQLSFIESLKVDIKTSTFEIRFKKDADIDIDAIRKGVEDAGFSVAKLQLTGAFDGVAVKEDAHTTINGKNFHFLSGKNTVLNGEQQITIVDRNFLGAKEFKKYARSSKMDCVETGKAASCCEKDGISAGSRIYHVTI